MNERDELFARARRLAPLIESRAAAAEEEKTLTSDVVEALRAAELFWMLVPRELGGLDVDVATYIDVVEEIACADGSAGWTLMANAVGLALASGHLADSAVERIFGGGKRPVIAAVGMPGGKLRVREGGYVATAGGHWRFASGCAHSEWVGAGFTVLDGAQPKLRPDGSPETRMCWFPRENIEIIRKWNVLGLVATGSFEFVIPEQEIDEAFVFDLNDKPRRGRHLQNFGSPGVAFMSHASVALGLAKRALQEIAISTAKRRRASGYLVGEHPVFRLEYAEKDTAYRAARALLVESFREAEAAVRSRGRLTDAEEARLKQAMISAHSVALEVVRTCWGWSGSEGIARPGRLERLFRDMHVAAAHSLPDKIGLVSAAVAALGAHRDERERASRGEVEREDRESAG